MAKVFLFQSHTMNWVFKYHLLGSIFTWRKQKADHKKGNFTLLLLCICGLCLSKFKLKNWNTSSIVNNTRLTRISQISSYISFLNRSNKVLYLKRGGRNLYYSVMTVGKEWISQCIGRPEIYLYRPVPVFWLAALTEHKLAFVRNLHHHPENFPT